MTFSELNLIEPLLRALASENYVTPTPIQARSIPLLLAGRDLLGIAQTGTGKTAAFALPLLQQLANERKPAGPKSTRALILAPTRELAMQISMDFKTYGRHLGLRQAVVFGGVGQGPQVNALARGVDILIATPGRLLDLMSQKHLRLDSVSFLILDEADRMLDMGFIPDVRRIMAVLPKTRQSLLFSATMPENVARLSQDILTDPVRVEITPAATTVDRIDQKVHFVEGSGKRTLLSQMLTNKELARVIVFTRTKHGANRVAEHLENSGVETRSIHGNKSQSARQKALNDFRHGKARVLVATDIAARGIDIDDVSHVVNYELPNEPENYVHRIGRTARAGATGIAIAFCDATEMGYLRAIERLTKRPLEVVGGKAFAGNGSPPKTYGAKRPGQASRKRFGNGKPQPRRAA